MASKKTDNIINTILGKVEGKIKPLNSDVEAKASIIEQLETFLKTNYAFKRNAITRYIELDGKECDTIDFNSIYIEAKKKISPKVNYHDVEKMINSHFTPDFNPIHDFFESHKHRKTKGCIKELASCFNSDSGFTDANFYPQYVEDFLTRWLVGLVSSAFGKYSPLLLVLSGGQNTGKTEFFRRLLPAELMRFYAESRLDAGKDDEILMCQKLMIMDDEFGGKSKKAAERLKELTSKQVFTLREPYGRKNIDLKRLAVLCGTSNDTQILSDPTGNRRIIPIHIHSLDFEKYNSINKIDLLIDAYHLYKSGFKWELKQEDIARLNENTVQFEEVSSEKELIHEYFDVPKTGDIDIQRRTPSWMMAWIFKKDGSRLDKRKFILAMKRAGFEYKAFKVGGESIRGFEFVIKNSS